MLKSALHGNNHNELTRVKRDIMALTSDVDKLHFDIYTDLSNLEQYFFNYDMVIIENELFYSVLPRLQTLVSNDGIPKRKGQRVLLTNFSAPVDKMQINEWLKHVLPKDELLEIPILGGRRTENMKDVIYFENRNRVVYVKTRNSIYQSTLTLREARELVSSNDFLVPYVSYVLNAHWIESIKGRDILLKNKETIPLSQKKSSCIRKAYREILSKQH